MREFWKENKGWITGALVFNAALFIWVFFIADNPPKPGPDQFSRCLTHSMQRLQKCISQCTLGLEDSRYSDSDMRRWEQCNDRCGKPLDRCVNDMLDQTERETGIKLR